LPCNDSSSTAALSLKISTLNSKSRENGPATTIGELWKGKLKRPRKRVALAQDAR